MTGIESLNMQLISVLMLLNVPFWPPMRETGATGTEAKIGKVVKTHLLPT